MPNNNISYNILNSSDDISTIKSNFPAKIKFNSSKKWDILFLKDKLKKKILKNVFVSINKKFLFSKNKKFNRIDQGVFEMSFDEFINRRIKNKYKPFFCSDEYLYLYGEPLTENLKNYAPDPYNIINKIKYINESHNNNPKEITSSLLWVTTNGNISPLHYDLSEGLIYQLNGIKSFYLCSPKYYKELYPYPCTSLHDRQSKIDDINNLNFKDFPLYNNLNIVKGKLMEGELLYIPFGWWHQIESENTSISVTYRWNPYSIYQKNIKNVYTSLSKKLPNNAIEKIILYRFKDIDNDIIKLLLKRCVYFR